MRLLTLLKAITPLEALMKERLAHIEVSFISYDSRKVEPGTLFVAIAGTHVDGHRYIDQAIQKGACAVIAQYAPNQGTNMKQVPIIVVSDTRAALAALACEFYQHPSHHMKVIGVTGTSGKTTTTNLIGHVLDGAGHTSGFMSTANFKIGERIWANTTRQSTQESLEIQQMLAEMRSHAVEYAILETTSHALVLNRVEGVDYDIAIITNITTEHLDFHGTLDAYWRAKGRLFEMVHITPKDQKENKKKWAILNADDASYRFIQSFCRVPILTYGIDAPAHVRAYDLQLYKTESHFCVVTSEGEWRVHTQLCGRFNVYNCLAALAVGYSQGLSMDAMVAALKHFRGTPGRLEWIDEGQPFTVVVDYAHTPDGLEKVLQTLRPLTSGNLFVIFGLSGERDTNNRPLMGAIAMRYADMSIFTTDDPREEDPCKIIDQIAEGAEQVRSAESHMYLKQPDRREAITYALAHAQSGDTVLLAGKGHEQFMLVGRDRVCWDDRVIVRELLATCRQSL